MADFPKPTCLNVKLEFVLEFERNAVIPMYFVNNVATFITHGIRAIIPKKEMRDRFGDAYLVLGTSHTFTLMRPQDVEKRRRRYIKWVHELDAPAAVKKHLIDIAKKVKTHEDDQEASPRTPDRKRKGAPARRARKEVPDGRKALRKRS